MSDTDKTKKQEKGADKQGDDADKQAKEAEKQDKNNFTGSEARRDKHLSLNEMLFNHYVNSQSNKPTDLLMSPFHPFYFVDYKEYDFEKILVPGKFATSKFELQYNVSI